MHVHAPIDRRDDTSLVRRCVRGGATTVVLSGLGRWNHRPGPGEVRLGNQQALALAERFDPPAAWLAYLDPQNDTWPRELDRCLDLGASGIKLWVSLKDSAGRLHRTVDLLAEAGRRNLPVLVHTFNRTDPLLPGEVNVQQLVDLSRQCPDTTIIAAHAGGNAWHRVLDVLHHAPDNLLVDISGSYPKRGMVDHLVDMLGTRRILFGTDLPGRSLASQLAKVAFATLDDDAREAILWKNAVRVFKLDAVPDEPNGLWLPTNDPTVELLRTLSPGAQSSQFADQAVPPEDHALFLGRWPTVPDDPVSADRLDAQLHRMGFSAAYIIDLDTLLDDDLYEANLALRRTVEPLERLRPLCVIDPRRPEVHRMVDLAGDGFAGVWLGPYLHGWKLDERRTFKLLGRLASRDVPVWLNVAFDDHRFRPHGARFRPVAPHELVHFLAQAPTLPLVVQGAEPKLIETALVELQRLGKLGDAPEGQLRFDLVRTGDRSGAVARLLKRFGPARFVHGSEYPLRHLTQTLWTNHHEMEQSR